MKKIHSFILITLVLTAVWQVGRTFFTQEEKGIRTAIRSNFEDFFSSQFIASKKKFGLNKISGSNKITKNIVLIHGLDDPGKVWINLIPVLTREQYNIWVMNYPNDQPISLSAKLFHEKLVGLKRSNVNNVVIVAHSMGGLVARETLTNPDWQCSSTKCTNGERPNTSQLIMVGTPNHGSALARFRGLGEIREQFDRMMQGNAQWLDWIFDGAGEAGIDLVPKSHFLTELNNRPHPDNTDYYIIAGIIGNQERNKLKALIDTNLAKTSLLAALDEALKNIGDGLVTLNSATLKDKPIKVISGNHLSIIRNIRQSSTRVPPAIPIIIYFLNKES